MIEVEIIGEEKRCDDCISRQAAIDAAIEAADEWDGGYSLTRAEMIENKLKDLPSAQLKQRWIPVSEHLPKQNEMVLITIIRKDERYNKIPFISTGYISWNNTAWWCAHDGDCKSANVEVLAWLPLPEPYREERRTDG